MGKERDSWIDQVPDAFTGYAVVALSMVVFMLALGAIGIAVRLVVGASA